MLKISNLSVKIENGKEEKYLLKGVDLTVGEKEIHCVLGKNGSGKSTLAKAILGLGGGKLVSGKINFLGKDIFKFSTSKRAKLGMTMAFQEPARFEGLSVEQFLKAGDKNLTGTEMMKILKMVDLQKEMLAREIDEKLSGGERKRIEIASVIAMKPRLMILDEPDASLDIIVYNELYDLMFRIKEEIGCSILLITHQEEAGMIADRATLLEKGKVVKTGRFREVMRSYCEREGRQGRCMAFRLRSRK